MKFPTTSILVAFRFLFRYLLFSNYCLLFSCNACFFDENEEIFKNYAHLCTVNKDVCLCLTISDCFYDA